MSATRTVTSHTKTADQERQDRLSRRDASRVIALAKEAARKETRNARNELVRLQRESLELETHIAQLRAALSQNCPSSDNAKFQAKLIRAENRQRTLAERANSARARAFSNQQASPNTMAPEKDKATQAEVALRASLLQELQALKASASAETLDPDAWNIVNNTTPEDLAANVMDHYATYAAITKEYSAFTQDVAGGNKTRTESREEASALRGKVQDLRDPLVNLTNCLGTAAPQLAAACQNLITDLDLAEECLQKVVTASRLGEPHSDREKSDDRDIVSGALSAAKGGSVPKVPMPGGFFRESLAPGSFPVPDSWKKPIAPVPTSSVAPISLPGVPESAVPSSIYTQAGAALSQPTFAPENSFSSAWHNFSTPYKPPPMFRGHACLLYTSPSPRDS